MSKETSQWLNQNVLIGYTAKRGNAWHWRAEDQGDESNHYEGAIPVEDIHRRLIPWEAIEGQIAVTGGGHSFVDPDRKAIMRSDTGAVMGIFKNQYVIHQYAPWLIENVETIVDGNLAVGSAGLLKGGAQMWVQVEVEDTMEVNGVEHRPFITAATSMDGSLSSTYLTGTQVTVCDNTLAAAVKGAHRIVRIKHSSNSMGRVNELRDALDIVHGVGDAFAAEVEALTNLTVTDDQWAKFVAGYTGATDAKTPHSKSIAERKTGDLMGLWTADERVTPWAGTGWGVMQAVNTYTTHLQTVRGTNRAERNQARFISGNIDREHDATLALLGKVLRKKVLIPA